MIILKLPPDLRRNLMILFAAGLFFWSSLGSMLPTLPLYIQDLGGTSQQVGLVMGSFAVGLLASRSWLGSLADRRSRKLVLVLGMAAVLLAPLGYLIADRIWMLAVIRAFHGVSIAAFAMGFVALVVDLAPDEHRGGVIGYMSLVNPIGIALGPAMGGFLQAEVGYLPLFLAASGVGALGLICGVLVEEKPPERHGQASQDQRFWSLLGLPHIFPIAVVMLLIGLAFGTLSTFAPLLIKETGVDLNVGLFYSLTAMASFAIRLFTGSASDRFGRGVFLTFSLSCYAVSMTLLVLADSVSSFVIAALVEGSGFGTLIPMISALAADRAQAYERGRVFSLCMTGFDLGIGLAGPLLGSLADDFGYRGLFSVATVLSIASLVTFMTASNPGIMASLRFALGRGGDAYALKDLSLS